MRYFIDVNSNVILLFQWFYDVRQAGVLELAGAIPSTGDHPITSGSALVLLHDQDSVGKLYNICIVSC